MRVDEWLMGEGWIIGVIGAIIGLFVTGFILYCLGKIAGVIL